MRLLSFVFTSFWATSLFASSGLYCELVPGEVSTNLWVVDHNNDVNNPKYDVRSGILITAHIMDLKKYEFLDGSITGKSVITFKPKENSVFSSIEAVEFDVKNQTATFHVFSGATVKSTCRYVYEIWNITPPA